ncbi:hypothetical protein C672_0613 [[Clostridium] bifermentans ATCC 638]|uniref:Uncharacterized protein n=1 Tax=Paraclostridium bifermentans ATCC 638 = DSM 14991 TaxID=1233171 RepID=T4VSI3_PARBF|nr:hypothetical protein [Paraclostridium bifermentans]EQK44085.1 hypothetical protein C672_0613 [[Clostridium] bifermentans ATCC 638] [Paraclostridium bifermentans ATCC 638 = DSM 14991]RIZ58513.1 hypothetical protein CHH45_10400 [Paraclostridium bifermentans]UAG19824.1 hypothetical protein KXZ80_16810 [Paraclostridium bifermentans]
MPKIDINLLNEEVPTTRKSTIVNEVNETKPSLSIYDIVKKEKKKSKEQVGVTLDKDIVDKLKTVVIDSNITMSKLFENLLTPLLEDVEISKKNVDIYNNKNKLKGRRKSE